MVLQKQTAHKLTVNVPEVLATADIERDRLLVASLVSSSLIERLVNIMGDAQIQSASAR
jgi:hypothetical protein